MTRSDFQTKFNSKIRFLFEQVRNTSKSSVVFIQQRPRDDDENLAAPLVIENASHLILIVEIYSVEEVKFIVPLIDGAVDAIVVDSDVKLLDSTKIIKFCQDELKSSKLYFYSDYELWANSIFNTILTNESPLGGKFALITGRSPIASIVSLRLIMHGTKVYTTNEGDWPLNLEDKIMLPCSSTIDYSRVSFVIGVAIKEESMDVTLLNRIPENINLYDGGIGNFNSSIYDLMIPKHWNLYRLDNRIAISGFVYSLFETNELINSKMGKVMINDIEIVAGGVYGSRGAIIVDNITDPQNIVGVADGKGFVKYDNYTAEEEEHIAFVRKMIM